MTSALPIYKDARDSVGLASIPSPTVHLVTVRAGCMKAVAALNKLYQTPGKVRRVWLFELGTSGYAVEDPGIPHVPGEESPPVFMFTHQFVFKTALRIF